MKTPVPFWFAGLSIVMLARAAGWPPFDPPPAETRQVFPSFAGPPAQAPKLVPGIPAFHGVALLSTPDVVMERFVPAPLFPAPGRAYWVAGAAGEELVLGVAPPGRSWRLQVYPHFYYYWTGTNFYLSRIKVDLHRADVPMVRAILIEKYGVPATGERGSPSEQWRAPGAQITLDPARRWGDILDVTLIYSSDWGEKEYRRRAAWLFKAAAKEFKATPQEVKEAAKDF